jgi:hypothetical protein
MKRRHDPDIIEFRLTILLRLTPVIGGLVGVVTANLAIWITSGVFYAGDSIRVFLGVAVAGSAYSLLLTRGIGITLTPIAAEVENLRRRTIPWSDIQAIRIGGRFGYRTVVLHQTNGRRTRLRAPITGLFIWDDKRFEEKYHTIGRWWLDHRAAAVVDAHH